MQWDSLSSYSQILFLNLSYTLISDRVAELRSLFEQIKMGEESVFSFLAQKA